MSIRLNRDESPDNLPFAIVAISVFISLFAAAITVLASCFTIRAIGLQWAGETFGGGTFNWKDALVKAFIAVIFLVVFMALISFARRPRRKGFDMTLVPHSIQENSSRCRSRNASDEAGAVEVTQKRPIRSLSKREPSDCRK